ncbi:MAG: ATPase [Pacificimonas sp.]|nr:ATPase [Pacificimonas sp.]
MLVLAAGPVLAGPVLAENAVGENGFTISNSVEVSAEPAAVWALPTKPQEYWNPDHGYSGDAANFSMTLEPGGCFCERLGPDGFVEHMRVVMVVPNQMLRLSGALGPLQSEGLAGHLTWTLKPREGGGTIIEQSYVAGGHMKFPLDMIAPAVDGVLGEQLTRLAVRVDAGE